MTSAEHTAAYRRYAAEATFYMLLWQAISAADEDERQRARAERLPVAFPDDVWDRVPVWSASPSTGRWERSTWMRARS